MYFTFSGNFLKGNISGRKRKPKETEILILSIYIQPQLNSVNAETFNLIDWKTCKEIFDLWC